MRRRTRVVARAPKRATRLRCSLPLLSFALTACGPPPPTEAQLALCHGEPLRSAEAREQAMMDGYEVSPGFGCITKDSYAFVQQQKAEAEAANTPEAKARREAERVAQYEAGRRAAAEEARLRTETPPLLARQEPVDVSPVDVNTADEARLAAVISVGAETASQIVAARTERPFADWADLTARVLHLSQAQPAVFASTCGLVVNGESLDGAPPNALYAVEIRKRYADE